VGNLAGNTSIVANCLNISNINPWPYRLLNRALLGPELTSPLRGAGDITVARQCCARPSFLAGCPLAPWTSKWQSHTLENKNGKACSSYAFIFVRDLYRFFLIASIHRWAIHSYNTLNGPISPSHTYGKQQLHHSLP
jgi:hypothetical protein